MEEGDSPNGQTSPENALSVEEFARLQDELMALRMYHEELLGERRWLKNAEKNHQAAQAQAGAHGAFANVANATRSLSSQVKVGTEALSSLGRGMEAFSKQAQAQAAAHMKDRSEVESLKARIRAAQEEAQEFRSVAANARQVAQARSQERAMQEAEADQSDDDEDTMLLKQKIKAQQDQLDRLLEIFRRQQEQVVKLQDQLSGREEERQKVLKREVEAKLKDRESQVEALLRQLRCAEEESRESMELRSQLRDFAEQSINRDHVLAEMRSVFKQQAAVDGLQQERLFMVLEDLKSFSWNRPWHPVNEMEASSLRGDESPTDVNASAVHVCEAGSAAKQVQVDLDPANALPVVYRRRLLQQIEDLNIEKALLEKRAAREVQDLESLVKLQQDDLRRRREAKSDSPKPLPKKQEMKQDFVVESDWQGEDDVLPVVPVDVQSAWFAAQKVEFHDISSDGEDVLDAEQRPEEAQEYPAGLHYVQRVAELEAQSDELKQCLEALHASESALRRESQEKNDLIAVLLRKAKLPDSETGVWRSRKTASEEEVRELERIVEETTEDNIRLRNDMKIMSDELRKVLRDVEARTPKAPGSQKMPRAVPRSGRHGLQPVSCQNAFSSFLCQI